MIFMGLIEKLGVFVGITLGTISYANAQSDTTIIEYKPLPNNDLLITDTDYNKKGEIVGKSEFLLEKNKIHFTSGKNFSFEYDTLGRITSESERIYDFKGKNIKKPAELKDLKNRIQLDEIRKSFIGKEYTYDQLGRMSMVKKSENTQIGKVNKPAISKEYYFYIGDSKQAAKLEDNNKDGQITIGVDKVRLYNPKTKKWVELVPKEEEPLNENHK